MPIGFDPGDLAWIDRRPAASVSSRSGALQLCAVGTLLPLGVDTVRAVLAALASLQADDPELARQLHLRFVGTSNQARGDAAPRAMGLAAEAGVAALVSEEPMRIPFLDALRVVRTAGAVLIAGTSEARYTASKLDVALATGRPILAIVHERSDIAARLSPIASRDRSVRLITRGDASMAGAVPAIRAVLDEWRRTPPPPRTPAPEDRRHQAPALAQRMASMLETLVTAHG
jgi:hypothetical protein